MSKGQLIDMATYLVMGVVIAVAFLVGWLVMDIWNDEVAANPLIPQSAKDVQANTFGNWGTNLDKMFMLMYIGILLGSLVLSYVLRSNPALFFILLIVMFILSMIAGYLGNAWTSVSEQSLLAGAASSFGIMSFVMSHYLMVNIFTMILMIIVFFAKPDSGVGY